MSKQWTNRSMEERLSSVGRAVVMFDRVTEIQAVAARQMQAHGTRPEGQVAAILGDTRIGKTRALDAFMVKEAQRLGGLFESVNTPNPASDSIAGAKFVTVRQDERILHPIISIEVNVHPTFVGLVSDVIFCLTRQRLSLTGASFSRIMNLIYQQLVGQGVRLLIFDNAQHVIAARGGSRFSASEIFKILPKVTGAETVLVGTPELEDLLSANAQLNGLVQQFHKVRPFSRPEKLTDPMVMFLQSFSDFLPFDLESEVDDLETAQRIHACTEGRVGLISILFQTAVQYAIEHNLTHLEPFVLAEALRRMGVADTRNAFLLDDVPTADDLPLRYRWHNKSPSA